MDNRRRRVLVEIRDDAREPFPTPLLSELKSGLILTQEYFSKTLAIDFEFRWGTVWRRPASNGPVNWRDLLDRARDAVESTDGMLTIALSGAEDATEDHSDETTLGSTDTFGHVIVVRRSPSEGEYRYFAELLVHEIAHTFGAWHTTETSSSMRAVTTAPQVIRLDRVAESVLRLTKWRRIGQGIRGVDPDVRARVAAAFTSEFDPADHPILCGWESEVRRSLRARHLDCVNHAATQILEILNSREVRDPELITAWRKFRRYWKNVEKLELRSMDPAPGFPPIRHR